MFRPFWQILDQFEQFQTMLNNFRQIWARRVLGKKEIKIILFELPYWALGQFQIVIKNCNYKSQFF